MKDERGSRRERDNRANGGEKYDRSENLHPSDYLSNKDGPDGGNLDETMYDTFGGQGMHGAPPFPSDIAPPPVLMPVPGAGYVNSACGNIVYIKIEIGTYYYYFSFQ